MFRRRFLKNIKEVEEVDFLSLYKALMSIDSKHLGHYTPHIGFKIKISVHYPNIIRLINSVSELSDIVKNGEFKTVAPPYLNERVYLDDFLVNNKDQPITLQSSVTTLQQVFGQLVNRYESQSDKYKDYYKRKYSYLNEDIKSFIVAVGIFVKNTKPE